MSVKHTPGPWIYAREFGPSITELPRITTVARCADFVIGLPCDYPGGDYRDGDPSGDEEADARLIAAAPELLAVLKELQESASYWSEYDVPLGIVERIKDAIAKATGALE